jgi:hypothetical protein
MLFDLRSRGRRRTMQVVYIGLAVLMASGLVLFGVGTGSSGGGLLGGLSGSSSSNNQSSAVGSAAKKAQTVADKSPGDPTAWANLIQARWEDAESAGATSTGFTSLGKQQLTLATQAWERYSSLVSKPDVTTATYAARAYSYLGNYSQEAHIWDVITSESPSATGYKCLALSAYAAKNTGLAELAKAKLLPQVAKSQRSTISSELESASTDPTAAQGC